MPKEYKFTKSSQTYFKECLMIQDEGEGICQRCSALDTDKCDGKNIIKTGKNKLNYKVPLQRY